jgi:hypothetical protein
MLEAGTIVNRFVPSPSLTGHDRAVFLLVLPFAESYIDLRQSLQGHPGNVLLWSTSSQGMFGAFFYRASGGEESPLEILERLGPHVHSFSVTSNLSLPSVPIYFDFEGAWSRGTGLRRSPNYPRPIPEYVDRAADDFVGFGRKPSQVTERIVLSVIKDWSASGKKPGEAGLLRRRSAIRLLHSGSIAHRYFLDPTRLPPYNDWTIKQIVLLHGSLLSGKTAPELFHSLVEACGVFPFLFAVGGDQVMLGTVSPRPEHYASPPVQKSTSVLSTVQRFLSRIAIHRTDVGNMENVVNHRYDRMFKDFVPSVSSDRSLLV